MIYTNSLVKKLQIEERKRVELYGDAHRELQDVELDEDVSMIVYKILHDNKTIPVVLVDEEENIISYTNIDTAKANRSGNEIYLKELIEDMKDAKKPIEIQFSEGQKQFIYYKDSTILTYLFYYPYVQLGVICLFIFVAYLAFSTSRKSEQNQVWVGMSKETAHQLGTPISSLIAWVEMLKLKNADDVMIQEVAKDVERLQTITERFSKIGAAPELKKNNIVDVLNNATTYLKSRTSRKVKFILDFEGLDEIQIPMNVALFEWVIENICKNAIDAMNGAGQIEIKLKDDVQVIYIDITDTGKGIAKSKYKTIFQPGFTTKKRGWGLGLSLTKRIVEINHGGKVFVKNSEINKGTTFRIVLKK
ncbi:MAG: ATP-binding protein [Bacteroidia bacterium]|nr:MAG: ATP-binding protein [Bacteroidia bacterium]